MFKTEVEDNKIDSVLEMNDGFIYCIKPKGIFGKKTTFKIGRMKFSESSYP